MDIEDKQREESFKPINKSKRKTTKLLFDEPKINKKSKIIAKNQGCNDMSIFHGDTILTIYRCFFFYDTITINRY